MSDTTHRGEQQNWRFYFCRPQSAHYVNAFHSRHHSVEDDDFKRFAQAKMQGFPAIGSADNRVAKFAKPTLQIRCGFVVVFGQKDTHWDELHSFRIIDFLA
jgi:hypothetical protein